MNATKHQIAAWLVTALLLVLVLTLHLLPALLAGLLVYELVRLMAARLSGGKARLVAVVVIAVLVILILSLTAIGLVAYFRSDGGSLQTLLQKMAEIVDHSRELLPGFVVAYLPDDADAIRPGGKETHRSRQLGSCAAAFEIRHRRRRPGPDRIPAACVRRAIRSKKMAHPVADRARRARCVPSPHGSGRSDREIATHSPVTRGGMVG